MMSQSDHVLPPSRSAAQPSGISRDTVLLAFASLFSDVSTEMLYPVLPVFLTQTLKAGGTVVGLVDGLSQATQNIIQGLSGWLSDRLQRRKPIALVGYTLAALAKPLIGLAAIWQGVLGARFLDRLGAGIRSAPRDALLAASVDEKNRGRAFGLEGAGDNLGAFLGPLLALALLAVWRVEIRTIFFLAIIPGLLSLLMVVLVAEHRADVSAKAKLEGSLFDFPPAYWRYLAVIALFGAGNSSNAFLILHTRESGASLQVTILIYAAYNLVAAAVSYPAGSFSDRWGRKNVLLLAFIVFLVAYLGFAVAHGLAALGLLFALYGVYQGIFRSIGKAFATDFVPARLRASGVGWFSATVGLLELFASLVAGVMWDRVGHAAVFYYGAASAAVGAVALVGMVPGAAGRRLNSTSTARSRTGG